MSGLNRSMHASYWGSSAYFRAWQTSRNFRKALGQLLPQSCFAVTSIFVLQTLKPLLGPCSLQQLLSWNPQKQARSCSCSIKKTLDSDQGAWRSAIQL